MVVPSFLSKEESHIKVTGMLVVSLRGVNYRLQISFRVRGMESRYICPFSYH